jgi:hypothetical protein
MYVEEQRKNLRTNQVVDRATGRLDLRYAPLSIEDDYFIPVRGGESGTRIDTLAGGQNAAAVEDVAYIQKKLFAALKIPRAYLGYDEMLSSKATLAQEDIRFSRTINVIQKVLISELNKLAIIHLYSNGFDTEELQNFTLRLSNPSTVAQQQKLEIWRSKFEIAGSIPEGMGSKEFARKMIWGLTDEQIEQIDEQRYQEKLVDQVIEEAKPDEGTSGEETGGEETGGEETGGEETGGEETGGEEEAGGEEAGEDLFAGDDVEEKEPETELLMTGDADDLMPTLFEKDKLPVKAKSQLKKALYDRSRRKTRQDHMVDFKKITDYYSEGMGMKNVFGTDYIKDAVSNPLKNESVLNDSAYVRPNLPLALQSTLQKMSTALQMTQHKNSSLLSEGESSQLSSIADENNLFIIDED